MFHDYYNEVLEIINDIDDIKINNTNKYEHTNDKKKMNLNKILKEMEIKNNEVKILKMKCDLLYRLTYNLKYEKINNEDTGRETFFT